MSDVRARELITTAQHTLDDATAELMPPVVVPTAPVIVHAGESWQAAHDAADDGATILVEVGSYAGALVSTKRITWQALDPIAPGRIARDAVVPTLRSTGTTLLNSATDAVFIGLGFTSGDPNATIVADVGVRLVLDRVLVLGDPVKGQHRGCCLHGTDAVVRQSVIDHCFAVGRDAQAVACWDGTDGLTIFDCYLGGGAQSFMAGGADAVSADRIPKRIKILASRLSKELRWYALGAQIKCAIELKDVIDFAMADCVCEYAGISGGSTGYAALVTPRNQNGTATYSTISGVTFDRSTFRYAGGGMNFLGSDDEKDAKTGVVHQSGPLADIAIRHCFFDLDPTAGPWKGPARCFIINRGPAYPVTRLTLDSITVHGAHMDVGLYVIKAPLGLVVNNLILAAGTKYGDVKVDAGGGGWSALQTLAPDTIVDAATRTGTATGAVGYPA